MPQIHGLHAPCGLRRPPVNVHQSSSASTSTTLTTASTITSGSLLERYCSCSCLRWSLVLLFLCAFLGSSSSNLIFPTAWMSTSSVVSIASSASASNVSMLTNISTMSSTSISTRSTFKKMHSTRAYQCNHGRYSDELTRHNASSDYLFDRWRQWICSVSSMAFVPFIKVGLPVASAYTPNIRSARSAPTNVVGGATTYQHRSYFTHQHHLRMHPFSRHDLRLSSISTTRLLSSTSATALFSTSTSSTSASSDPPTIDDEVQRLQQIIMQLNGGQPINVNSPKQVSIALFGAPQTATKSILEKLAMGRPASSSSTELPPDDRQKTLAQSILQLRVLIKEQQQASGNGSSVEKNGPASSKTKTKTANKASLPPHYPSIPDSSNNGNAHSDATRIISHEEWVEHVFANPQSQIDGYWKEPLTRMTKSTAQSLVSQLDSKLCPMGYNPAAIAHSHLQPWRNGMSSSAPSAQGKKGSFLDFCRTQKRRHPHYILLTRCGDFYETFGLDAILLVEHVGLNSMAGKCKAGCPHRNIQATLNGLTEAGFSVAVYEEVSETQQSGGGGSSSKQLKTRVLTQIVSPAAPTYLYDQWLLSSPDDPQKSLESLPSSRPFVGIVSTSNAGYALVQIQLEERTVHVSERLTPEAVACRLAAEPPSDPILVVLSPTDYQQYQQWTAPTTSVTSASAALTSSGSLSAPQWSALFPFLPASSQAARRTTVSVAAGTTRATVESSLGGYRLRTTILPPFVIPDAAVGMGDTDRYSAAIVNSLLQMTDQGVAKDIDIDIDGEGDSGGHRNRHRQGRAISVDDFQLISASSIDRAASINGVNHGNDIDGDIVVRAGGSDASRMTQTNPLYVETATQLGLLHDKTIPALLLYVLDDSAPMATRKLIQRYLLVPPPPVVAEALRVVVMSLQSEADSPSLPPLHVPPLGKVLSLLRVGQASARIYGDLLQCLFATHVAMASESSSSLPQEVIDAMLILVEYESGLSSQQESLVQRCSAAVKAIEDVISPIYHVNTLYGSTDGNGNAGSNVDGDIDIADDMDRMDLDADLMSYFPCIPGSFLERNEAPWRGRVRPSAAADAYKKVRSAAQGLSDAIQNDFVGNPTGATGAATAGTSNLIVHDIFNNLLALRQIPEWAKQQQRRAQQDPTKDAIKDTYFHPRDRNGKLLKNRYTTGRVQSALSDYVSACDEACQHVSAVLTELADRLHDEGHIPAIVQSAHFNLVLSSAFHHATKARTLGWSMAEAFEMDASCDSDGASLSGRAAANFVGVWPYWMDKTQAVSNTFDLDSLFLLTAPNMSGKSTLMRSTAAAALLTACGLCAPVGSGSRIPRFDIIFCRGASADVPAENKSAFGAEMGDIAALLRCCGSKSLIFVDELGRGTSPKDGTRLAGAVLEAMAQAGMRGFFATHLHGLLDLPLEGKDQIRMKRMGIMVEGGSSAASALNGEGGVDVVDAVDTQYDWTYRLEDGVCTDSLALVTAARFGLPKVVIDRANFFSKYLSTTASLSQSSSLNDDEAPPKAVDNPASSRPIQASSSESRDAVPGAVVDTTPVLTLEDAVKMSEDLVGERAFIIPPRWSAPAPIAFGRSCVYIIEMSSNPPRFYVGETDNLQKRMEQHRKKWSIQCRFAAIPVSSKTEARGWESRIIQQMSKSGYGLVSIADGRTLRHFQ